MRCTRSRGSRGFQCLVCSPRPGERGRYPAFRMPKPKLSIRLLLGVVAVCGCVLATHVFLTQQFRSDWEDEQQFICENGLPKWPNCTYPCLEVESEPLLPDYIVALWPLANAEIFHRITVLDASGAPMWVEGFERCEVFKSVKTIRINAGDYDIARLSRAFAKFKNLETVEIVSGCSPDFGGQIAEHLQDSVEIRGITM